VFSLDKDLHGCRLLFHDPVAGVVRNPKGVGGKLNGVAAFPLPYLAPSSPVIHSLLGEHPFSTVGRVVSSRSLFLV
jgi:hypothetical protein